MGMLVKFITPEFRVKQPSLLATTWRGCNVCVYVRATRMSDHQL